MTGKLHLKLSFVESWHVFFNCLSYLISDTFFNILMDTHETYKQILHIFLVNSWRSQELYQKGFISTVGYLCFVKTSLEHCLMQKLISFSDFFYIHDDHAENEYKMERQDRIQVSLSMRFLSDLLLYLESKLENIGI